MNQTILTHLRGYTADRLSAAVADLEAAVAAGLVPNTLFVNAKDIINRAVNEGVEAFLKTGPHHAGHNMSDWWLTAYRHDALVSDVRGITAGLKRLKRAINSDVTAYTAFLTSLLPLRTLLEDAKPLVKKRGEMPKVKTAKQIADEADQMTCQCCGRGIYAATGLIAHHGYERPAAGWQTASCFGARELPFEVSRDVLGEMIENLKVRRRTMDVRLNAQQDETVPFTFEWTVRVRDPKSRYGAHIDETHSREVTRATFDAVRAELADVMTRNSIYSFDVIKNSAISATRSELNNLKGYIAECQKRYDGWKQTHTRAGDKWEVL